MFKNIIILLLIVAIGIFIVSNGNFINKNVNTQDSINTTLESNGASETKETVTTNNSLDLSNQGLEKLPEYVLEKSSLENLDISNNNLTGALPAEIRHLKNLKILDASNNQMTGIPAELGQLEKLEILNLSNNKLTGLPYELGNLKNLKRLDLSGNEYSKQDLEKIKSGLNSDVEIIVGSIKE